MQQNVIETNRVRNKQCYLRGLTLNSQSLRQMTGYCAMVYKSITTVIWAFKGISASMVSDQLMAPSL